MENNKAQFLNETTEKIQRLTGVDLIYFLDNNNQIIKEQRISNVDNYLDQVVNTIKLEPLSDKLGSVFYSSAFHTYSLLNESGVIVISKIFNHEKTYLVIIAGENTPVDLVNLLKLCKEVHSKSLILARE